MHGVRVFSDLCVGCPCCKTACKAEKSINTIDINPLEIEKIIRDLPNGEPKLEFVIHVCKHCADTPCLNACKEGALVKNENGTVVVLEEKCVACRDCVAACPYDGMKFDENKNTVTKCDLCFDRVKSGRQPACVLACPAKVIYVGEIGQIEAEIEKRRSEIKARRDQIKQERERKWADAGIEVPYFDI